MNARQEYIDYLERYVSSENISTYEANLESTTREVGKSYGLTEFDLAEIGMELSKVDKGRN